MRRLEGPELVAYDLIAWELAAQVRIQKLPFLAPGASGMTIGRLVLLRSDVDRSGNRELIAHELVHVRQYEEAGGVVRFLRGYLRDYVVQLRIHRRHRPAYLAIPAEAEAREHARQWARRRRSHPSR